MADPFSGPSFLYHLLANELSVVLFGELDKTSENYAPLPSLKARKQARNQVPEVEKIDEGMKRLNVAPDVVLSKLESMGYQVGQRLIERLLKDHQRFKDELEIMKYICTDLWKYVYDKQIDTLRTNNHGTYVFTDNTFKPLAFFSAEGIEQYYAASARFITFPCGIIRGALSALGIRSAVSAKATTVTSCVFEVIVERS